MLFREHSCIMSNAIRYIFAIEMLYKTQLTL